MDLIAVRTKTGKARVVNAIEQMKPVATIEKRGKAVNDPQLIDRENAFLLYATFCGDVTRTAAALHADVVTVLRVVDEEHWNSKLTTILELRKSAKPGEVERGINRTMNFVQCHRLRNLVERQVNMLSQMSDEELKTWCMSEIVTTNKDGSVSVEKKLHTRPFADLATAMEKVQMLSYTALNDTNQERAQRAKDAKEEQPTTMEIHSAIAKAMSEVGASKTPRALLLDAHLAQEQNIVALVDPNRIPTNSIGIPSTSVERVSENREGARAGGRPVGPGVENRGEPAAPPLVDPAKAAESGSSPGPIL